MLPHMLPSRIWAFVFYRRRKGLNTGRARTDRVRIFLCAFGVKGGGIFIHFFVDNVT